MNIGDLVLHPVLRKHVNAYCSDPPHALLIYGKKYSGKVTLARAMAEAIQNKRSGSTIVEIAPLEDKKTIGIDQIRQLKIVLRTKSSSFRIIIIPNADKLLIEAQNSFLKLLEEPPEGVVFILTTSRLNALLPTIRSRVLKLPYILPTKEQQTEFAKKYTQNSVDSFLLIANGRIPILKAMLDEEQSSTILAYIDIAKDILGEKIDSRLLRVDSLSKDAYETEEILEALMATCSAALKHAVQNNKPFTLWLGRVRAIDMAHNQIERNVLPKLVLSRLFLVL